MTPQEFLNEFYKMPPVEQKEVLETLSEELSEAQAEDLRIQKALFDAGLLREIKSPRRRRLGDFKAVKIEGKPISETIIEDRR
ncbi:MAG: hypothetical protein LH472_05285 [Pyrinomonadaceae bacterium]|nr:hypothetical protein [Pyrinomonadaceae bacterium]